MDFAFCGSTRNWFYLIFFIYLSRLHLSTFLIMESPTWFMIMFLTIIIRFDVIFLLIVPLLVIIKVVLSVTFFVCLLSIFQRFWLWNHLLSGFFPVITMFIIIIIIRFCYSLLIVLFIGFNQGGIDEFLWCFFNEEM